MDLDGLQSHYQTGQQEESEPSLLNFGIRVHCSTGGRRVLVLAQYRNIHGQKNKLLIRIRLYLAQKLEYTLD